MIIEEKLLEMRGMKRQELIDYFMSLRLMEHSSSIFIGEHWRVQVMEELFVFLGSFKISSTTVIFIGEKDYLEEVIYRFRLRFLTAGG